VNVELRRGGEDEARIVKNLWPLYQHDVSAFDGAAPNRHGVFGSDATTTLAEHAASLDPWWEDPDALFPYLIVVDGAPAGFDLIAARRRRARSIIRGGGGWPSASTTPNSLMEAGRFRGRRSSAWVAPRARLAPRRRWC
jgi:hypothetical protein